MNRIKELRENLGLRQIDVSMSTGIDQKTLSNYETEKTNPDSYALIKLADFFDVSIDFLVGRVDNNIFTANKNDVITKIDNIKNELNELKKFL